MGVGPAGPVTGEVLDAGGRPTALQAPDRGGDVPGRAGSVGPERPHADHRVERLDVDVGDRREVGRHPGVGQPRADRGVRLLGRRHVVEVPEGGGARARAAAEGVQPGDVAALLVQGDDDVAPGGPAELVGEPADVAAVTQVRAEQHDAAEAVGQGVQQPVRRGRPDEAEQQAGARQAAYVVVGRHGRAPDRDGGRRP